MVLPGVPGPRSLNRITQGIQFLQCRERPSNESNTATVKCPGRLSRKTKNPKGQPTHFNKLAHNLCLFERILKKVTVRHVRTQLIRTCWDTVCPFFASVPLVATGKKWTKAILPVRKPVPIIYLWAKLKNRDSDRRAHKQRKVKILTFF